METHYENEPAQTEKCRRNRACRRQKLFEQSALLHEKNPAHRADVGRRHEGNQKSDIEPMTFPPGCAGKKQGQRGGHHRCEHNDQAGKHDRIDDRFDIL